MPRWRHQAENWQTGAVVGAPGMRVGNLRREELPEAFFCPGVWEEEQGERGGTEPLDFPALDFRGERSVPSERQQSEGCGVSHGCQYT